MAKTAVKPAGRRKRGAQTKMTLALFSMMLPGLIYLIINNYIPMAGLVIAFKRFNYGKGIWGSDWAGLSNFTYLFKTQDAKNIIRNTIGYNLTFILLGNVLAVAVAVMLNFMRGTLNKKNIPDRDSGSLPDFHGSRFLHRVWFPEPGKWFLKQNPGCYGKRSRELVHHLQILAFHPGICKPLERLRIQQYPLLCNGYRY